MKKVIIVLSVCLVFISSLPMKAETYFKSELSSGNAWMGILGAFATYPINKAAGSFVIDNYLTMSTLSVDADNYPYGYSINYNSDNLSNTIGGYKFPALLSGLGAGIKLGYSKQYPYFIQMLNIYGSLHATYNYFILDVRSGINTAEQYSNSILKVSPGIGANVHFGKFDKSMTVAVDFNLKYDVPVLYKGKLADGPGGLKSGFSPRITVIFGGAHLKKLGMNIGLFYEWATYNQFKSSDYFTEPYKTRAITAGMNFTMFPWK